MNVNNILAIVNEEELLKTFRPKDRDFDSIEVPTAKESISIKDGKNYVKLNWLSEDNSFGYQTEYVQKAIKIFSDMGYKRKDLIMYVPNKLSPANIYNMRRNSNMMYIVIAPTVINNSENLNLEIKDTKENQLEKWK